MRLLQSLPIIKYTKRLHGKHLRGIWNFGSVIDKIYALVGFFFFPLKGQGVSPSVKERRKRVTYFHLSHATSMHTHTEGVVSIE